MYWAGQDEDDEDDQNSFSQLKDRAKEMDLNWSNKVYVSCEQNLRKRRSRKLPRTLWQAQKQPSEWKGVVISQLP